MKEPQQLSDQEFADFYNVGYGLNKMAPEIADLIDNIKTKSPVMDALKAGIETSREPGKDASYLPDWLKDDWFRETGKEMTKNKDKGIDRE